MVIITTNITHRLANSKFKKMNLLTISQNEVVGDIRHDTHL